MADGDGDDGGWQEPRRRSGRQRRGLAGAAAERLRKLEAEAKELKATLFRGTAREEKAEWRCQTCHTTNFADRAWCRHCAAARGGAKASCPPPLRPTHKAGGARKGAAAAHGTNASKGARPTLPAASAWAAGPPLGKPTAQAAVLDKAAAAARAAGAPGETLAALARTAADARRRAEEAKPPAQRLAAAEKRLVRAKEAQAKRAEELDKATTAAAAASQTVEEAAAALATIAKALRG